MKTYSTLHELVTQDRAGKTLFDALPKDVQVALQEQRQDITTYEGLLSAAAGYEKRLRG